MSATRWGQWSRATPTMALRSLATSMVGWRPSVCAVGGALESLSIRLTGSTPTTSSPTPQRDLLLYHPRRGRPGAAPCDHSGSALRRRQVVSGKRNTEPGSVHLPRPRLLSGGSEPTHRTMGGQGRCFSSVSEPDSRSDGTGPLSDARYPRDSGDGRRSRRRLSPGHQPPLAGVLLQCGLDGRHRMNPGGIEPRNHSVILIEDQAQFGATENRRLGALISHRIDRIDQSSV